MLVEGRIKQPPSSRSEISNCAVSVWPSQSTQRTAPDPAPTASPSHQPPSCCRLGACEKHSFPFPHRLARISGNTAFVPYHHHHHHHLNTHNFIHPFICKLLILLILLSCALLSPVTFQSSLSLSHTTCCHLLIISIILFYYYFRFRLRILLKFVNNLCLTTISRFGFLSQSKTILQAIITTTTRRLITPSSSLARQTSLNSVHQSRSSIDSFRPSQKHNSTTYGFIFRLILIVMMVLALSTVDVHYSSNRLHLVAASTDSDLLLKHSTKGTTPPHSETPSTSIDRHKVQPHEHRFLGMMGLSEKPRPSRNRKVPEHMLDLYHWFRQGNIVNQQERELIDQEDEENTRPNPSPEKKNSVLAVTSDDLSYISINRELEHYQVDEDDDDENVIKLINQHHRVLRRKRQTQPSRVTLLGPANTIISHKLSDLNQANGVTNRRIKRNAPITDGNDFEFSPGNEVHLTFDIHLPTGEFLKGAELRMYRHSIYDLGIPTSSTTTKASHRKVMEHNNLWPLYQDRDGLGSVHESTTIAHNSQSLPQNNSFSTGEEYSESSSSSSSSSSLPIDDSRDYMQRINIYHLLRPIDELHQIKVRKSNGEETRMVPSIKLIDTQVVDVRDSGWLSFDTFPATERWLQHPSENFGLLITFMDYKGQKPSPHSKLVVVNQEDSNVQSNSHSDNDESWHEVQPLIITYSNTKHVEAHTLLQRNRVKRHQPGQNQRQHSTSTRSRGSKRKKYKNSGRQRKWCSRHQLFVDFADVGWNDWIVAPPGFQSFYCSGECSYPLANHLNTTNHAIIQSLVNSINKAVVPEPCCIPTDLSPITLLYLDQHEKIVLKNYNDMVVEGCGCQ